MMASSLANGHKRKKLLHSQAEALVASIEANPTLIRHPFTGTEGQALKKNLWGGVARDLNKLGPHKTWSQWKQTWKDMKAKTRRMLAMKAREKQLNPQSHIQIPPLDRRILALILSDGDEESITVDVPALKPEEQNDTYFENSQDSLFADSVKPDDDVRSVGSSSSDRPRKIPRRNFTASNHSEKMNMSSACLERLMEDSNRHVRELTTVARDAVEVGRELADASRGAVEVGRNIAQALWGIASAIRNANPALLGQINEDFGEEGRS